MAVPYTFGSATSSIPLSQLDSNFATTITLGNTVTTLNNMTMANVTVENMTSSTVFGFKNRIINGAMVIDQRNAGASVSTTTTGNFAYSLDRFSYLVSQASKFTIQQNAGSVTPPVGFSNYLGVTSSSAYSIISTDYFNISQPIEGFNTADLAWGTASAATITLSFWVRSSLTGTFGGSLRNSAANRSYPYTYTISSANTWEQKTITIAGDTSGTWVGATNGVGLQVLWGLGVGSTYSGTAGAWAATNYLSATGATSVVGTNGATFYITGVQLEKGSTATSFDYRPYGTELALCQRYFYKTFPQAVAPAQNTNVTAGTIYYIVILAGANYMGTPVYFPVTMRATPTTLTFYNPQAANAKWRNTSSGTDSGSTTSPQNLSQYGFLAINNPQVAGDAINNSIIIHATAEAEL